MNKYHCRCKNPCLQSSIMEPTSCADCGLVSYDPKTEEGPRWKKMGGWNWSYYAKKNAKNWHVKKYASIAFNRFFLPVLKGVSIIILATWFSGRI